MRTTSPIRLRHSARTIVLVCALLAPVSGWADMSSDSVFALRNQHPFIHIYGLPPFQSANLAESGHPAWNLNFDIANHADFRDTGIENFVIDGETYFLTLSMRRRVTDWLELGFDAPLVSHADGFMDNMIEGWHDVFGMSNSRRRGPSNELGFLYQSDGEDLYRLDAPASGIGDIQLTAAIPLRDSVDERTKVAIRSSIKLPTGDASKLLGSGGTDFSAGLYVSGSANLFDRPLALNAFVGGVMPGDSDVLPGLLRDFVAFGGGAAMWQATERIALGAQLYMQAPYYDSDIKELGGNTIQLAVGTAISLRNGGLIRLAIMEDVAADTTTDFGLHISVQFGGGVPQ